VRAIARRYSELNGRVSAAAITLYGLFALFALCVLAVAVVGILATDNDNVAEDIVSWLGLHGDAATTVIDAVNTAQHSAKVASVVGIVGLVWVGSSLAVASAYDVAWGCRGAGREHGWSGWAGSPGAACCSRSAAS